MRKEKHNNETGCHRIRYDGAESLLETGVHITDKITPKDVERVLMTKDEFDFTSTYYYGIRKMEVQEELQKQG